ncbi:steroid 5-alpha-reductase DET2-like [Tasmannia lanceolata]|uniref:steroid 5-alpha-reductase DET2-like n=1 Tax=Tasmannia lanceolata TaxID=3420 RepID=UPI0040633AED
MASTTPSSPDQSLFTFSLLFLYLITPLTFISLQFIQAPYGKHFRSGWGPSLPAPFAWFLMESPTLFLTLLLFPLGKNHSHPFALTLISFFLLHYFHRTVIYPTLLFLRRRKTKPTTSFPISIALTAFAFNLLNTYLQSRWVSHYADFDEGANIDRRFWVGVVVFLIGMGVNVWSDRKLMELRGGGSYRIPKGGLFEWVSCPNYLGEAVEWFGWAVMTWSWVGLGFFLYTCANLVPRAEGHRKWYVEKFGEEYPKSRKAIFPFVY